MGRAARKSDLNTRDHEIRNAAHEAGYEVGTQAAEVTRLRPHADNVVVLLDHHNPARPEFIKDRKTAGGIYLPEQAAPTDGYGSVWGTVIESGPGNYAEWDPRVFIPNDVTAGDRVCITGDKRNSRADLIGDITYVNGLECRIVRMHDIGAVEEGS